MEFTATQFQTMQEVDQYLSQDTIACLVCGKEMQRLKSHIMARHNLTTREYRLQFGIPMGRSLTSAPSRAKSANMSPERLEMFRRLKGPPIPGGGIVHKVKIAAVSNRWKEIIKAGQARSQKLVIAPCVKCGSDVATTLIRSKQDPTCMTCATPRQRRSRMSYWRRKWAA